MSIVSCYKKNTYFVFLIFLITWNIATKISCVELIFINISGKPLQVRLDGWKKMYGLLYRQEEARVVKYLDHTNWIPTIKKNIEQTRLFVYDDLNKLIETINFKKLGNEKVGVPAGYTRTIIYSGKAQYEDILELTGKKLSPLGIQTSDFLEIARQEVISTINKTFGIQRKIIRESKDILNPEIYDIIYSNPYSKTDARVRVGGPVSSEKEREVFNKRKDFVKKAQEKLLGIKFLASENPLIISFVMSGGGQRARLFGLGCAIGASNVTSKIVKDSALEPAVGASKVVKDSPLESASGVSKIVKDTASVSLMDCGMYISALSGGTWFLAPWLASKMSLDEYEKRAVDDSAKSLGFVDFAIDSKYCLDIIQTKFAFGQSIGVFDVYGSFLASTYLRGFGSFGNPNRVYLSDIAKDNRINDGLLPIPVFASLTSEYGIPYVECDFTPWEFGSRHFGYTGAYIPVWAFGRNFESINKTKNWANVASPLYEPQATLGYMMGIWGSAPAANFKDIYNDFSKKINLGPVKTVFELIMKKSELKYTKLIWPEVNNFMYGWSSSVFSNYKYLKVVDAGMNFVNPIFSTYRRPSDLNKVRDGAAPDVIIVWDSGAGSASDELKLQRDYATKHNYPFPDISAGIGLSNDIVRIFNKNPSPKKYKDYEIPTVIYMKAGINKDLLKKYKDDKLLGVLAKKLENFDYEKCKKGECKTFNFQYIEKNNGVLNSQLLIDMAKFNIMASEEKIKDAIIKRFELNRVRDGITQK